MAPTSNQLLLHIPPLGGSQLGHQEKGKECAQRDSPVAEQTETCSSPQPDSQPTHSDLESAAVIVGPTAARSLRRQSSRSFAARNKGSSSALVVPGSSANPIIAPADIDCYVHVGMAPAATGETAQQARTRHNVNETQIASFLATLERSVLSQDRIHRERMEEMALLVQEVRAACDRDHKSCERGEGESDSARTLEGLVASPVILQLHSAVVEDRNRITELVAAVQRVEKQIGDKPSAPLVLPHIPSIPPSQAAPSLPKRALDSPIMPPQKRFAASGQDGGDVFYGPVDTEGNPREIAEAVMEMVSGLQPVDVYNARYAPGQPGVISIRFRNGVKADRFIAAIAANPPVNGQTAVRAGAPLHQGVSAPQMGHHQQRRTPLDIIRGVGKSSRRR